MALSVETVKALIRDVESAGQEQKPAGYREIPNGAVAHFEDAIAEIQHRLAVHSSCINGQLERIEKLEKIKLDETFKTYSNFERRLNEHAERIEQLRGNQVRHAQLRALDMKLIDERLGAIERRVLDMIEKERAEQAELDRQQNERLHKLERHVQDMTPYTGRG